MSSVLTGAAPQPSAVVDTTIESIFRVGTLALMSLQFIPGIPPAVLPIATTVLQDLQSTYAAYKANPSADLITQMKAVLDTALDDLRAHLHPTTP